MPPSYSVLSGFVILDLLRTARCTLSTHIPRASWFYCQFHSPYVHPRDIDSRLAPAVIAASDFLRRGFQACR